MKFLKLKYIGVLCVKCVLLLSALSLPGMSVAHEDKVLRYVFVAPETGFDPAVAQDIYSSQVITSIYETLFTYDYLARPVKVIPGTARALPTVSNHGKTYTIHLKSGIYFAKDEAFGGKRRELVAEDYIYALKRLMDPSVRSAWRWLVKGKIVGLDALEAQAKRTGHFDYNRPIAGLKVLDRYTIQIQLTQPDYQFVHILAHYPTSAVAKEVVSYYGDRSGQIMANPVGTGAYRLTSWQRGAKIILDKNPDYRGFVWNFKVGNQAEDRRIVQQMSGKHMPQISRVEISVIPEDQSRWLAFSNQEIDLFSLEGPLAPRAIYQGHLRKELADKGIQLSRQVDPELVYYYFNMRDPVVGGLSLEKIALRRAIAMAHNVQEEINVIWNGQAKMLDYPIPPGVIGYDSHYENSIQYEPRAANALLDEFGYTKGKDGWRRTPSGKPLVVTFTVRSDSTGQQQLEMWKKTFDKLHIRMRADKKLFPDLIKAEKQCQVMMRTSGWIADYPDASNFMQNFYGKHIGQSNHGCSKIPLYDILYERAATLPQGKARDLLYHKMARVLEVYAPIRVGYARYRNMLLQPYVMGYKKHPVMHNEWLYIDIDSTKH